MQKAPLFVTKKELQITLFVLLALFLVSLSWEYYKFKKITTYSIYKDSFVVINSFDRVSKNGKIYKILKLKNSDFSFNGVYFKPIKIKRLDKVEAIFYTDKVTFYRFLKGFYAPLKTLQIKQNFTPSKIETIILNQHSSEITKELYGALFFAMPLSKSLREDIAKWGVSHLLAISGFHFGIIGGLLFLVLKLFYKFFQDRYFPYRNLNIDLGFLVLLLLGCYAFFIGFSPSVLRAFVMGLIGYFFYIKNIKIISFEALFITASAILIIEPRLLFSIAFWFSIGGVFYLFLFLYHFSNLSKTLQFILINFWVFFCMMPLVHYVFCTFSLYQFFSPFLSMAFVVFYPLSLALHVVGFGSLFDSLLIEFLKYNIETSCIRTSVAFLAFYLILSIVAIRYKKLAFILPFLGLCIFI